MSLAAPRRGREEAAPPPIDDPHAVRRNFVSHRRRRLARWERQRELKRARRRFWVVVSGLLVLALFLGVTIWEQVQSMFGI